MLTSALGNKLLGVIMFGSYIYLGYGNDVDLLVIIGEKIDLKAKFHLEREISKTLSKGTGLIFDVHILSMDEFRDNLKPGSFLSGLALGYEAIYDRDEIEDNILDFLRELSKTKYILHNEYGSWDLSHMARITYEIRRRKKKR